MSEASKTSKAHVWVVSTGSGYYADSVWSTRELAEAEARRLGLPPGEDDGRNIKLWFIDEPDQIWAENSNQGRPSE